MYAAAASGLLRYRSGLKESGSSNRSGSLWIALTRRRKFGLLVFPDRIIQRATRQTYHQFKTTTESLGMKWPSYQSSSVEA